MITGVQPRAMSLAWSGRRLVGGRSKTMYRYNDGLSLVAPASGRSKKPNLSGKAKYSASRRMPGCTPSSSGSKTWSLAKPTICGKPFSDSGALPGAPARTSMACAPSRS
ncbi:hypothetical protein D3C81_2057990 [compost metagenome]